MIQNRRNYKSWVKHDTKDLMKIKDTIRDNAAMSKQDTEWTEYRRIRNICSKKQKADKTESTKGRVKKKKKKKK